MIQHRFVSGLILNSRMLSRRSAVLGEVFTEFWSMLLSVRAIEAIPLNIKDGH